MYSISKDDKLLEEMNSSRSDLDNLKLELRKAKSKNFESESRSWNSQEDSEGEKNLFLKTCLLCLEKLNVDITVSFTKT